MRRYGYAAIAMAAFSTLVRSQCQLCPEGSFMGRPEKLIVGSKRVGSCHAIDALLSSVPTTACESVLRELNEAPVDFREYCECSDYVSGPNFCSLCGNAALIGETSNQPQRLLGGYTCAEYSDLAGSAQTLDYCDTLRVGQSVCCEAREDDKDSCQVCESGAEMQLPNRRIILLADNVTCETYDRELETYAQHPYCDGLPGFSFASYCHCEGAKAPKSCQFCSGTDLSDPNLAVYVDGLDVWLTCEELALAAVHTSDESLCSLLNANSNECCGVEAPVTAEASSSGVCQVCDSGAQMALADRPIIAHVDSAGNQLTCASFDQYLGMYSNEMCQGILADESIDLASYCGCSDAPASPDVCQPICGADKTITDPTTHITLDGVNITCAQAELLNAYFVDESLCAFNFPVIEATCCANLQSSNSLAVFGTQTREYRKYLQHTADEWINKQGVNPSPLSEIKGASADYDRGTSGGSPPDVAMIRLAVIAHLGILVLLLR